MSSFRQAGPTGTIEQNTLHIGVGGGRVATIRVGTPLPDDVTPATKYILGDHLGTAAVVIDDTGSWVNREEYSPYGETMLGSYARKSATDSPAGSEMRKADLTIPRPAITPPGSGDGSRRTRSPSSRSALI